MILREDKPDLYRNPITGRRVIVEPIIGTHGYSAALYDKGATKPRIVDVAGSRSEARALAARLLGLKPVHLQRGRMEAGQPRNGRPGYAWVNAWRLVTARDCDAVQPWSRTKTEARQTAEEMGYLILGELD